MSATELDLLIGVLVLGPAAALGVRLRDGVVAPVASALAPGVAMLVVSTGSYLLGGIGASALVALVLARTRRSALWEIAAHLGGYWTAIALYAGLDALGEPLAGTAGLALGLSGTAAYSGLETVRQKVTHKGHARISADLRMWLLLQAVLLSAGGLTVLVLPELRWPTFPAMAMALVLTRREFQGYADSRRALDQTVRALDGLSGRIAGP